MITDFCYRMKTMRTVEIQSTAALTQWPWVRLPLKSWNFFSGYSNVKLHVCQKFYVCHRNPRYVQYEIPGKVIKELSNLFNSFFSTPILDQSALKLKQEEFLTHPSVSSITSRD